jgi:hypothetical protein
VHSLFRCSPLPESAATQLQAVKAPDKVGSHDFAFSAADTKSIGILGLLEHKRAVLMLQVSPFGDSAKSKRLDSSPTRHYTVETRPACRREGAFLQGILMIG